MATKTKTEKRGKFAALFIFPKYRHKTIDNQNHRSYFICYATVYACIPILKEDITQRSRH